MTNNDSINKQTKQQISQIMTEMQTAADTLQEINWGISVFGSARIKPNSPYYALSETLGSRLARAGFPVIAGGGPGIMEAANKGAYESGGTSVGLNIHLPRETSNNPYQTHSLFFDYFFSRKATFFMHSAAYVALPGGWGTLDEVFEVMTLVQTQKIPPAPIILIGSEFWNGLLQWIQEKQVANKMVSQSDMNYLLVTDDLDEVIRHIKEFCAQAKHLSNSDTTILS